MKKRTISVAAALVVAIFTFAAVLWFWFPERFFVSCGSNGIASIEVIWKQNHVVVLTDQTDIQSFCEALKDTSSLCCKLIVDHDEGIHADPVYRVRVSYTNGEQVFITTSEGGHRIYKFFDPQVDHGDHAYISSKNEALLEWAKDVAFS